MDSNRFRHWAEEYCGGASQDSGAGGDASWTSPESFWSNGKGKEIDPAELLFPGSCYLALNPTRPSPEMPPNYGLFTSIAKTDVFDVTGENQEKGTGNSSCSIFPSWEGNELGALQNSNQPIYQIESELTDELELRCRELQLILRKELTNSDVGNVGRVVLPKREAEAGLPPLSEREGIVLQMHDMTLPDVAWKFKYRFWPNNKSRMYVLEGTGDFVRAHFLQTGDSLIIYRNLTSGNFIVRAKKANRQQNSMNESNSVINDNKDRSSRRVPAKQKKNIGHGSSSLS